ncbi:elongation factor P--(R)-beta-lysine ligase [Legionella hackeliae]|uniref:Lysine--tRNA ligase n=1 Tax=Legionella hackeliae TaxID=449 RepID=A0A0A8UT67_LEGHA|nr:elongation factor P--(R)-beta-lysine ligase [Legionella hackeliae]KTD10465.1 lysyl-tRNA synthetase, class II [Legionella hackeliae]CEK09969.1 Lysine--tRNA ligase [Legionella hackeliae]STX49881.1 lysyl-tRNA synthetase, class II [Legionella hackeliae]
MKENRWQPSASFDVLRLRAQLLSQIRRFFLERNYLEVETPIMARFGVTDVYLSNIRATFRGESYCLQTSPEYHMKRLLAAGSGPIFQLARVFRDDELGRWHNPEFTMLEWYQLNINHHQLMDEVDALLQLILQSRPMIRKTYQQSFLEICGFDPFEITIPKLKIFLKQHALDNVLPADEDDLDQYLFLIMSHIVEPALGEEEVPVAIYNFPSSQAALAKVHEGTAERFEVYFKGVELANGFHELTDALAQANRFDQDLTVRQRMGLMLPKPDEYLLQALSHGLPSCSGVALGVDRLLALALSQTTIANVLTFDFSRA